MSQQVKPIDSIQVLPELTVSEELKLGQPDFALPGALSHAGCCGGHAGHVCCGKHHHKPQGGGK